MSDGGDASLVEFHLILMVFPNKDSDLNKCLVFSQSLKSCCDSRKCKETNCTTSGGKDRL